MYVSIPSLLTVSTPINISSSGGGQNVTTNRTYWPTKGGAVAFQPGWFRGHQTAFAYVNMGFGDDGPDGGPANMTHPVVPMFQCSDERDFVRFASDFRRHLAA